MDGSSTEKMDSSVYTFPDKKTKGDEIIAYVQSVSPIKRNKRNTLDYCNVKLQTEDTFYDAICFSKAKRPWLVEREENKTAIKISNYTKLGGGKSKLAINDMTKLSVPDPSDYCFQFEPLRDDQSQKRSLKEVVEQSSHMDVVTVSGKILLKSETEIVGKDLLKLAKATLSDGVTTIGLELWEDIIDKIIEGQTYTVSNARVRIWNKKKKLSTTKDSIVQNNDDENLMKIPCNPNVVSQSCDSSIEITNIKSVQEIQKFKQCVNCSIKIVQEDSRFILHCDRCGHSCRSSNCKTTVCAKIVIEEQTDLQKKVVYLCVFQNVLEKVMSLDVNCIDKYEVSEKLLLLDDITITYNEDNVVTDIQLHKVS